MRGQPYENPVWVSSVTVLCKVVEGVATDGFERRSGVPESARNTPDHPQNNFEKIENFEF